MSSYKIKRYSFARAKQLGVNIKVSSNPKKKIDVFKKGKKIASIGAKGYKDYATYIELYGKEFADKKANAYKKRHSKYRNKKGTNSYYADKILW